MKRERQVKICTNFVKSCINKTIGHVNEAIKSEKLEINKEITTWADKVKQNFCSYGIEGAQKPQAHSKRKKRHGVVMFVSMNAGKDMHFNLQTRVCSIGNNHQSDKNKCWSQSILRQMNYVQWNKTCELVLIVVTRNHKNVQRIRNRVLHI